MGDWIGLGIILFIFAGGLWGVSSLGRPPKPMTPEEFERRVRENRGHLSAVMFGLQEWWDPKAAKAVEVQKDLKFGHYDKKKKVGEGGDAESPTADVNSTKSEENDA